MWDDPRILAFVFIGDPALLEPARLDAFCKSTIRRQDDGGHAVDRLDIKSRDFCRECRRAIEEVMWRWASG
jgi:hypothetical protein